MSELVEILQRKLQAMFPGAQTREKAEATLATYGLESHEKEPERVRLAILRLAGDDINQVEKYTNNARQDYRDVLSWAEYPRQSKQWDLPDGSEKEKIKAADREEYEQWLEE